ncbi:hypothetical protein EVAR_41159_1 [Eumeta japonica]|uniref:Uncharacterized protein n=1 Tax=Eumeta variegata TaxID=151549 RepID=A0A4C1YDL4_EUMVA|nr:hypothetical protein EVAR_41159_1 [Eumeta japonica]
MIFLKCSREKLWFDVRQMSSSIYTQVVFRNFSVQLYLEFDNFSSPRAPAVASEPSARKRTLIMRRSRRRRRPPLAARSPPQLNGASFYLVFESYPQVRRDMTIPVHGRHTQTPIHIQHVICSKTAIQQPLIDWATSRFFYRIFTGHQSAVFSRHSSVHVSWWRQHAGADHRAGSRIQRLFLVTISRRAAPTILQYSTTTSHARPKACRDGVAM